MDSCFDLVVSHQHGVASYEVISWSTDIHILTKMVMTSDETQIQIFDMDISRPADYFIACYTALMRPNKVETAVHGCNCWLSVWTLSRRCPVNLFTQYQPCIIVCYFLFLADQIFHRSCVHRQHFRLWSFASSCYSKERNQY